MCVYTVCLSVHMSVADYSCALQKDILVHGRLYASQHYLCFYANIFRWETLVNFAGYMLHIFLQKIYYQNVTQRSDILLPVKHMNNKGA